MSDKDLISITKGWAVHTGKQQNIEIMTGKNCELILPINHKI